MSVKVSIKADNVLRDVKLRSQQELRTEGDPEVRYALEAGGDKDDALRQFLQECASEFRTALRVYLDEETAASGSDDLTAGAGTTFEYVFDLPSRKASGAAAPIADGLHSCAVERVLGKHYVSVGRKDLAEVHYAQAADALAGVKTILLTKKKPTYE